MIEKTKQEVEAEYSIANGREHNAEVVYGDTDSVMIKFGPQDLTTVMQMGSEAADLVTAKFVKPIKLEFEKVYYPYLLINKKRYAGLYWTKPEKYDKMDSKGIEVRKILPLIHIVCQCTLDRSARQLPACIHCHRDLPPQDVN